MAVLRMLARGLVLRCPHCGRGRIFRTLFDAHDACPACGRVFQRDPGDWTGGMEITLLLTFPLGIGLLFALMYWTPLSATMQLVVVVGSMAVVIPLFYRHVKGFWLGVIRAWEGPDPQPNPIREPEWFVAFWDREGR